MVFSTVEFIFVFLPLALIVYQFAKSLTAKYAIISVVSLMFIALGDLTAATILLLAIPTALFLIYTNLNWLAFLVLMPLFVYKYNGGFGLFPENPFSGLILPLGISFFSFQLYSLVRDWQNERDKVPLTSKVVLKVSAYTLFFPQLIAGPILRFNEFRGQRLENIKWNLGVKLFCFGLFKKVVIADNLGLAADRIYSTDVSILSMPLMWLGAVSYHFQIYFDFCGYSEMAIGLGLLFGVRLPRNFKFPYSATSMTDFWRRWHITLSRFFRDYVYIPLGGNRGTPSATIRNLFIVFLITGAWHGATLNFIAWGVLHGTFLMVERLTRSKSDPQSSPGKRILGVFYVNFFVCLFWVPFRSENLDDAISRIGLMFNLDKWVNLAQLSDFASPLTVLTLAVATIFSSRYSLSLINRRHSIYMWQASVYASISMLIAMLFIIAGSYSPFIYFRF